MKVPYPNTRAEDVEETLAGVGFDDPYRWLERDSDEVRAWQRAQAKLASAYVREWPNFERLKQLVAHFSTARPERGGIPRYAGGRWFRVSEMSGSHGVVTVCDDVMGEGQVLFDPASENPERPPHLSWIAPSPDGKVLALGLCSDASENNTIRLVDVATQQLLGGVPTHTLMDMFTGGVQWLADSSGFFFSAITGAARDFDQRVYLHRRAGKPTTVELDIPWTKEREYRMVTVSRDGRYAVAVERESAPIPIAVANLNENPLRWRRFLAPFSGTVAGHVVGDRYVAVTDLGARRGRLISISLDAENPNDLDNWKELVGESEAVLRTVTPVGSYLYLTEFLDTYSRIRIVDDQGTACGEVPLPARSAVHELTFPIMNLSPRGHPEQFIFSFSSLTISPGIYRHTPGRKDIETLQAPQVRFESAVVEDRWAVSKDGTLVPYHLVRRDEVNTQRVHATLIYAYGGFNAALIPQFPGPMAAFVAAGGVFVHAHLRGGGELGLDWWQGGRLQNKQNSFDDLYAIAEDLIAQGRASPQSLAVTGISAGGLTAAVAATQRPELWALAVPRVARLDLIGTCRDPYGLMSTLADRANVQDPVEVRRLVRFSPYHLVREGIDYPAFYIEAGDVDPRCPPWHSRKFAARLQAENSGASPILLHVWDGAGHGYATDKHTAVLQNTEWLAFALRRLGINDWSY